MECGIVRAKLKFKSLSSRIWCMLAIMALSLIFCISIIYSLIVSGMEADYTKNMLKQAHEFFISDIEYADKMDKETIKSLVRTQHLLVQIDEYNQVNITPFGKKNMLPPEEMQVVTNKIVELINDDKKTEEVVTISYKPKDENLPKQQIHMLVGIVEELPVDSYIVSYMRSEVKPIWQKEFTWIGLAFIAGSFIIARIIAAYLIKPLKRLEEHAFKIANKDWVKPLEVDTEDEIGNLMHSINYMQEELKRKEKDEQRFLQSISHDLKTPIMVIEGHAEAIMDGMYVESLDHTAEIILKEAQRLEAKVGQMLYFNTLDYTLNKVSKEEVISMQMLVRDVTDKFKILSKSIEWQIDIPETEAVYGNAEQLEIAIENILDNELRYANKLITVQLKEDNDSIILEIGNDGEQIKAESIDQLFDYQYKEQGGKYGLGLAITKKIICYYKGSISAMNMEDGVRFKISLPKNNN